MILIEFREKLKAVSSDFSMIKNMVALLSSSSLPIRLICCFKLGLFNSIFQFSNSIYQFANA